MQLRAEPVPRSSSETMLQRYHAVRQHTQSLAEPLTDEDCCVQSMPDASPIKWHLAHTTWFFETFILERFEADFQPYQQAFRMLFNSYYNGIGEKYLRPQRGLLTRPSMQEVLAYRRQVDTRMAALLAKGYDDAQDDELTALVELGLQHEQQHQELILTDILHLLSMNPMLPAYLAKALQLQEPPQAVAGPMSWLAFDAGITAIGHTGDGFHFDNETPRHRQFLEKFALASRLVTNAEFAAFIEDGGYRNPVYWLSEGWDWVQSQRLSRPLYWQERDGSSGAKAFSLNSLQALAVHRPVTHLSFFEADAYARWVGARLPTEFEWEHAAIVAAESANKALTQLFGHVWQWTASSYSPYPGYVPDEGAIGEYNGKFMVNQYVLRGSSCVTPQGHARITYRNFFPVTARWQFTGIRLAKSIVGT